jgi:hypothetical protein
MRWSLRCCGYRRVEDILSSERGTRISVCQQCKLNLVIDVHNPLEGGGERFAYTPCAFEFLHSLSADPRVAVEKLEALIIGPKSDPSVGFQRRALPKFADTAGDIGRGDRI